VQEIEAIIGGRPPAGETEEGEHVEEVNLVDYDDTRGHGASGRNEAYQADDDEMGGGQPRVQCAHQ
jgi:hypothetical protein